MANSSELFLYVLVWHSRSDVNSTCCTVCGGGFKYIRVSWQALKPPRSTTTVALLTRNGVTLDWRKNRFHFCSTQEWTPHVRTVIITTSTREIPYCFYHHSSTHCSGVCQKCMRHGFVIKRVINWNSIPLRGIALIKPSGTHGIMQEGHKGQSRYESEGDPLSSSAELWYCLDYINPIIHACLGSEIPIISSSLA